MERTNSWEFAPTYIELWAEAAVRCNPEEDALQTHSFPVGFVLSEKST